MKRILILIITFWSSTSISQEKEELIQISSEGTVIYYLNQFFFFDFKSNDSFNDVIDSISVNKGLKLWAMDSNSYSELITNINCGSLYSSDSSEIGKEMFFMAVKINYSYSKKHYQSNKKMTVEGSFIYDGKLIPFVTYTLRLSEVSLTTLAKNVDKACSEKFRIKMEKGFSPGPEG